MKDNNNNELVLTLYPNGVGMGYIISDNPKEIINYGVARILPLSKERYIKRLRKFLEIYEPSIVVIRGYLQSDKRISRRTKKMIEAFKLEAENRGLNVYTYTRDDIKNVFDQFGKNTKYHINKTICKWYPELKHRMPNLRRNTQSEHYQTGLFDAFSLMLTHHYIK